MIPPILREVLSFGSSNITGYLRQEDGTIKASQGTCSSLLIFLEEDLTLLLHAQKETIRGVSNFILYTFYLFGYLFSNIGDNVQLKCKGVNKGRLMIPHRIPIYLIFACLIVIV